MIDLDRFKEHRDNIVMLAFAGWIGFLIVLQLMASAVEGFPKFKKAPPGRLLLALCNLVAVRLLMALKSAPKIQAHHML